MRFSCEFDNMSVKQPMLRQRSLYDALVMKFSFFFFCRLPNPPLTTPTKPRHTLSVRRCPFSPFLCRVPNRRQPTCSKKNFTTVKRVCESTRRSDRVGWSRGGSETAMLCGSLTLQLWQSHIVAVFSLLFFPSC